jgi:hypothetical protein
MLYTNGALPPETWMVAVPDDWHRLSVVVIASMDKAMAAGHCAKMRCVFINSSNTQT